jgi:hypothetical protein
LIDSSGGPTTIVFDEFTSALDLHGSAVRTVSRRCMPFVFSLASRICNIVGGFVGLQAWDAFGCHDDVKLATEQKEPSRK